MFLINWTDSARGKTFASRAGSIRFKSRDDKISHTLPMTRHLCNLDCVGSGEKPWEMGIAHSWHSNRKSIKRV